jgi:predicted Zn-dependent protease
MQAVTTMLTRRQWGGGFVATLAVLAGGCATISPGEERKLGQEGADEVEQTIGLVRDAKVVGYVRQVGGRLTQTAPRADVVWQFNVADDGEANAFALPGGWVYVTRGVLALLNSESELAGVLGHEMAHVLERHAARRVAAATPLAVIFGVPAAALGTVSPALGGIVRGTGRAASGVILASYNRDQEREADRRGIELAAHAGYDPAGLASFLRTLEREEALVAGRDPGRPRFFSTHPTTPERVGNVEAAARTLLKGSGAPIVPTRAAFVGRLEGLVVGDNPAHGVFLGSLFAHPDLDVALEMPAGWKTVNTPETAAAIAPGDDAAVLLTLAGSGDDPVAGAKADGLPEAQAKHLERSRIASLPAARLIADTRDGDRLALTWIAHRARVFRVTGMTRIRDWDRYRPSFERAAASCRPLLPADRERIVEGRLRVRSAAAGETVAQVVARGGGIWDPARTAVANGTTVEARLGAGWPVKVPVAQRYRGINTS